jgi:hypothetical protein
MYEMAKLLSSYLIYSNDGNTISHAEAHLSSEAHLSLSLCHM